MAAAIQPRQDQLDQLYRQIFGDEKARPQAQAGKSALSDEDLLKKAMTAANGQKFKALWEGSTEGYTDENGQPDESAADMALMSILAYWTGGDGTQMERLFFRSGLGLRDKWISRPDYRERTIKKAIDGCTEFYKPSTSDHPKELWEATPEEVEALTDAVREDLGLLITEEELSQRPKTYNPKLAVHLEPTNFISKYMMYASSLSDAYEEYHFASGLVLLSVAADRQIVISMRHGDIYPNIWIFPLGDSTISRKTTAYGLCKLFLKNKFPKRSLPSSFSPEALMDAIASTSRCYYLKDEAGSLLASLCKDYMQETRDFLAEIYECGDYYRKLKKSECEIKEPYITQMLMTTPDNLKEYTTPLDLTSGWLLRYLWMYPNYPKIWKPFVEKDEGDFDRWAAIYADYSHIADKLAATPRRLSLTPEAMQFFQGWQQAIEEQAMKEADNITKALAGRLMTNAIKMAALFTIGREDFDENSKIEFPHIQEAARLVESYFLPIGRIIIDEVARAESKNIQDKIIGTVKRHGGRISQRDLLRALHTKLKDVEEALEALVLSEEIESLSVKSSKGTKLYYQLKECHSDIVSRNEVYKENTTEGSLYTHSVDTKTLCQMGQQPTSAPISVDTQAVGPVSPDPLASGSIKAELIEADERAAEMEAHDKTPSPKSKKKDPKHQQSEEFLRFKGVLEMYRGKGPFSYNEFLERCGLSHVTVIQAKKWIQSFTEEGKIHSSGAGGLEVSA